MVVAREIRALSSRKVAQKGTSSTKNHRFESFTERISKLTIDPIRKRRRSETEPQDNAAYSHFNLSLIRWKDLNLSKNFTEFARQIDPISNSLPQILHHRREILESLLLHIREGEVLSLEPLFDLVSHLAHDLGQRFEEFHAETVTAIASIVTTHTDVEILEWGFNCLTWLFKYLSRLLVLDLRPTLRIMSPLLGTNTRKAHVTRFTAEALSFLVRKAASHWPKNKEPLELVIRGIAEDMICFYENEPDANREQCYLQGLLNLFLASIKGIDRKLHSCATYTYSCLINAVMSNAFGNKKVAGTWEEILHRLTIATIHHTDSTTFGPILNIIIDRARMTLTNLVERQLKQCAHLLTISAAVRHGTRIEDWNAALETALQVLAALENLDMEVSREAIMAIFLMVQNAPYEVLDSQRHEIRERLSSQVLGGQILACCVYLHNSNPGRFEDFLVPPLNNLLHLQWNENRLELYSALMKMLQKADKSPIKISPPWTRQMIRQVEMLGRDEEVTTECFAIFNIINHVDFAELSQLEALVKVTEDKIRAKLAEVETTSVESQLLLGQALKFYTNSSLVSAEMLKGFWPQLCQIAPSFGTVIPYLESLQAILSTPKLQRALLPSDEMIEALVNNLHSSVPEVRRASLDLLRTYYATEDPACIDVIDTALSIENTTLDLSGSRSISIDIRRLSASYRGIPSDSRIAVAIPYFLCGVTTFKLLQAKTDAIEALQAICKTAPGEDAVARVCFAWLEGRLVVHPKNHEFVESPTSSLQANFRCSVLESTESLIRAEFDDMSTSHSVVSNLFRKSHTFHNAVAPESPVLALQIMSSLPHVAEKRSRRLVPLFLGMDVPDGNETSDEQLTGELCETQNDSSNSKLPFSVYHYRVWMLRIFEQFKNPSVIYKSSEAWGVLNHWLASGDHKTQKSALKAIVAWRYAPLKKQEENLLNLLDESKFGDAINSIVQQMTCEGTIEAVREEKLSPVLLRILFGRIIARRGNSKSMSQAAGRRGAVFQAISQLGATHLQLFIQIALGPLFKTTEFDGTASDERLLEQETVSPRKQLGALRMIRDLTEFFGSSLAPCSEDLFHITTYCLLRANRQLKSIKEVIAEFPRTGMPVSVIRSVRQEGLQCLRALIAVDHGKAIPLCMDKVFAEVITPQLDALPVETAQSVSATLRLVSTLSASPQSIHFLVDFDPSTLAAVSRCLSISFAKEEVKLFVIDEIFKYLAKAVDHSDSSALDPKQPDSARRALQSCMPALLSNLIALMRESPNKGLLASAIELVSQLAVVIEEAAVPTGLLELIAMFLSQPPQRVGPKTKSDLLVILERFLPFARDKISGDIACTLRRCVCSLFSYLRDRKSRELLCQVFPLLPDSTQDLEITARLCSALNAFSTRKVDEPDFESRLGAFQEINEKEYAKFSPRQWEPIMYNMLFYVKDEREFAIRSNASFALRRLVEANPIGSSASPASLDLIKDGLLPAIRTGMTEESEQLRAEYLTVLAHMVEYNPDWDEVSDLTGLLMGGDEEASIFSNILHIQQHRRMRALRRLASLGREKRFRSANVAHILNPLVEHFIFAQTEDESTHNCRSEAITTLGGISSSLKWPQFRALIRRYSGSLFDSPLPQRSVFKLLNELFEVLADACRQSFRDLDSSAPTQKTPDTEVPTPYDSYILAETLPRRARLAEELESSILPLLLKYVHEKDETTVSLRAPVAVSIVRLLCLLPSERLEKNLSPVLGDVCNILRSRAQDSRDLARKTLSEISISLGPSHFIFVVNELKNALTRGYQLHVLSFTIHSILVSVVPVFPHGSLSYYSTQLMSVIIDDIFGTTGQEKDADEYISKMREVKNSKSYDSMELICKIIHLEDWVHLIRPIQSLFEGKLEFKIVRKVDELLRRMGNGLLHNEKIHSQQTLVLCHDICEKIYSNATVLPIESRGSKLSHHKSASDIRHADQSQAAIGPSHCEQRLLRFGLDLLRAVLNRYDDLLTSTNISAFVPIVSDALLHSNEDVQLSALRLLTVIIKLPLKTLNENAPHYISGCVKFLKSSPSTNTEQSQAALKLVTAILREKPQVIVREQNIAYLLKRLVFDLEEPDRQGVTFNFLKAVLTRQMIMPEVYETMDVVAGVMVTNHTKHARDSARGIFFRFLSDYPQSKDRFRKQLTFLVKNLEYKHPEGRQSILETINLLLTKVDNDAAQDILGTFFVPLALVMVNDESSQCQNMAEALMKIAFERASNPRLKTFLDLVRTWLTQSENNLLVRLALQLYGLLVEVRETDAAKELRYLFPRLASTIASNLTNTNVTTSEVLYDALQTFSKICSTFPTDSFASSRNDLWVLIRRCLTISDPQIQLLSSKLIGLYFGDFARTNAKTTLTDFPIHGSGGLFLDDTDSREIVNMSLAVLRTAGVSDELAAQNVRNLLFLAKIAAQMSQSQGLGITEGDGSQGAFEGEEQEAVDGFEGFDDDTTDKSITSDNDDNYDDTKTRQSRRVLSKEEPKSLILHLIDTTCQILRQPPAAPQLAYLTPLHSSLTLLVSLNSLTPASTLHSTLPTILLTLHNLTDPTIPHPTSTTSTTTTTNNPFTESYKTLQTTAAELISTLQSKIGITQFANVMQQVQARIKNRREVRRGKRKIMAVAEPERAGEMKRKKLERKKDGRKRKAMEWGRVRKGL